MRRCRPALRVDKRAGAAFIFSDHLPALDKTANLLSIFVVIEEF